MFISGLTVDGYIALSGIVLSGNSFSLHMETSGLNSISNEILFTKTLVEHVSCPECSANYFLKHNLSRHLSNKHDYDKVKLSSFNACNSAIITSTECEFYAKARLTQRSKPSEQKKDHVLRTKATKKRIYGDENYCNIDKIKQHMLDKYGVENSFQLQEVKDRISKNSKDKYGVNHWVQSDEFRKKSADTCMKNYGVDNPFKSNVVKQRIVNTQYKKYDGKLFTQTDEFMNYHYNRKTYICPSGRIIKVQGYENKALDILYKEYSENDILFGKEITDIIGVCWYYMFGKKHRYFPDMYIKSINTIIEVKSTYTFKKELLENILKRKYCIKKGINFEFMVLYPS